MSDPFAASVRLALTFSGAPGSTAFTDLSSHAYTVTALGDAQVSATWKQYGSGSLSLGGTGYLTVGANTDWSWMHQAGAKWCYETWVNPASFGATRFLFYTAAGSTTYSGVSCWLDATRKVNLQIVRGVLGTACLNGTFATALPNDGAAHHIAVQWDQALGSANATLYIDGVASGTLSNSAAPSAAAATSVLTIGAIYLGYFDDARLTADIRYSSNFTPASILDLAGTVTGIASTVVVPTFKVARSYPVAGIASGTALGTPKARMTQAVSGIASTAVLGTPMAAADQFPQVPGISSTAQLGIPLLAGILNVHSIASTAVLGAPNVANTVPPWPISTTVGRPSVLMRVTGIDSGAALGTPAALVKFRVSPILSGTRLGTPWVPTDRTCSVTGIPSTARIGEPIAVRFIPLDLARFEVVTQIVSTAHAGTPSAQVRYVGQANGIASTATLGTPVARIGQRCNVTGIESAAQLGRPTASIRQRASGIASTLSLGRPTVRMGFAVTGIPSRVRFGTPDYVRGPNARLVTGIASTARLGHTSAVNRFNHPVASIASTASLGTPTLIQGHRVASVYSTSRFGTPLLKRNPPC